MRRFILKPRAFSCSIPSSSFSTGLLQAVWSSSRMPDGSSSAVALLMGGTPTWTHDIESRSSIRRPAGLNSPATRSSAGFVMREIQTGLHKPEGVSNSGLREAPIIRRPFAFPVCGDLFEFLGGLPPIALLNPRIRMRHFRRPE